MSIFTNEIYAFIFFKETPKIKVQHYIKGIYQING